jgi:hypothetical protein
LAIEETAEALEIGGALTFDTEGEWSRR